MTSQTDMKSKVNYHTSKKKKKHQITMIRQRDMKSKVNYHTKNLKNNSIEVQ